MNNKDLLDKASKDYYEGNPFLSKDLHSFAEDFRYSSIVKGNMPKGTGHTYKIQDVLGVVLYRCGQFQVEKFTVPPYYTIPEHTHPNVESYEMYISGDIAFSHSGLWVTEDNLIKLPKSADNVGALIKVRTTDKHGGCFGGQGGVFISIQHWLNGVSPHSVALDYTGIVMGSDHMSDIKVGNASVKNNLTWRDAATKEKSPPVFNT